MMRGNWVGGLLALSLAVGGCGGAGAPGDDPSPDTPVVTDDGRPRDDFGLDPGSRDESPADDWPGADDAGPVPGDGSPDPGVDDPGPRDADDAAGEDVAPDPGPPPVVFCHRTDACLAGEVCNLSTGRCERRATALGGPIQAWGFEPRVAAPGDVLVVDGQAFYTGIFGAMSVRVTVSGKPLSGGADENRAAVRLPAFTAGPVGITGGNGTAQAAGTLTPGPAGVVPCGPEDPPPHGGSAMDPADPGPHAAGFVDFRASGGGRFFYPAACGGVRRPPAVGTFRVVVICHGDGALPLNYEYLGRHLASWGFVALMPDTSDARQIAALANDPASAFDGPVTALALDLAPGVVLVGHSRGTARIEQAWDELENAAGVVYLGPVNDGKVPAVPLLHFGATNDLQSPPASYGPEVYGKHPGPKIQVVIQGGNHSGFTDHKIWQGFLSDEPLEIERSRQHVLVQQFTLPFVQHVLGGPEPFADYLDAPPAHPDFTFQSALARVLHW